MIEWWDRFTRWLANLLGWDIPPPVEPLSDHPKDRVLRHMTETLPRPTPEEIAAEQERAPLHDESLIPYDKVWSHDDGTDKIDLDYRVRAVPVQTYKIEPAEMPETTTTNGDAPQVIRGEDPDERKTRKKSRAVATAAEEKRSRARAKEH